MSYTSAPALTREAAPAARRAPRVTRVVVSGFPRYQHAVTRLPSTERAKLDRVARLVVHTNRPRPGASPIRHINLVGHADRDVQRGAAFEKKMSTDRALAVWRELRAAIDRHARLAGRPGLSAHIQVRVRHAGAGIPLVKRPTTEVQRARNRRVEVYLVPAGAEPIRIRRPRPPAVRARSLALRRALAGGAATELERPAFPTPVTPTVTPTPGTFPVPWQPLISFRPSIATQHLVNSRFGVPLIKPKVIHFIEDGSGPINLDLYPVLVRALPTLPSTGRAATAEEFLRHIRLNLNAFIDTGLANFEPFNPRLDGPRWRSATPDDAVIHIDMRMGSQWANPDDGAVVVSRSAADHWIFSTLWTPQDQDHPVSGNRQFGFTPTSVPDAPGSPAFVFYTRGADRPTGLVDSLGSAVIFASAHALWKSLQAGIARFVNGNGGRATVLNPTARRFDWPDVARVYFRPTVPRV